MSYTPGEELLFDALELATTALLRLQRPILARLDNAADWSEKHLDELQALLVETTAMAVKLKRLSQEVR